MKKLILQGLLMVTSVSATKLELSSLDFKHNGFIPVEFTCNEDGNKGLNKIPKLAWEGAPKDAKSFALIVDDPDAPTPEPWVHWVVYNIPADKSTLDYITGRSQKLSNGTMQGTNTWPRIGWDGPCPPPGKVHHYHFKLYALDAPLRVRSKASKKTLLQAMKGHILAQAELIGLYRR